MKTYTVCALVLGVLISASPVTAQVLLEAHSNGVSATITRVAAGGATSDLLNVTWQPGDAATITLPAFIERYVAVSAWSSSKLVIIGSSANAGSRIVVVDRSLSAASDQFYARTPALSGSGQKIAFTQHAPRHLEQGSLLLLYDLELSPEANRMVQPPIDPMYDVGLALLPRWNATNHSYQQSPVPSDYVEILGPLSWWQDTSLIFLSHQSGKVFANALETGSGNLRRLEIDPLPFVDTSDLRSDIELAPLLRAEVIEPLSVTTDRAQVRFRFNGRGKVRTVTLEW